jgi:transposase
MRPNGSPDLLKWRRTRAVELMEHGETPILIARILGVTLPSLYRWRRMAKRGSLNSKPVPGRPRRLTEGDLNRLKQLLLQGATAHGWPNNLWTAARVGEVIKKHFGVTYHPAHVSRILRGDLNWTCQKPNFYHRDRNDDEIRRWMTSAFPSAIKDAKARGAYIVFIDEAGFMLEPTVRRTYAPCGQTPVERMSNPHDRISTIGAIVVSPRRRSVSLKFEMLANNINYRGSSIVRFLQSLSSEVRAPMTVFWDRIPIHGGTSVDDFLTSGREVAIEPFPPYAPELNPADGIWRYLKYSRLSNYVPLDLDLLRATLTDELTTLRDRGDLLRSFIRYTKLPIDLES